MQDSIIQRAQVGDQRAFQQLVEEYDAVVWRTARVLLSDHEAAQDAIQEAWFVTFNGQTITLQQAVITPSEAAFTVKIPFFLDQFEKDSGLLAYTIKVNGQDYEPPLTLTTATNSDVWHIQFEDPTLASKKGLWTLTIQQEFGQINFQTGQSEKKTVPGALWIFQFNVA